MIHNRRGLELDHFVFLGLKDKNKSRLAAASTVSSGIRKKRHIERKKELL